MKRSDDTHNYELTINEAKQILFNSYMYPNTINKIT